MLQGTLIRIWDTAKRVQLVELRRGADQARIYCINFSCSDEWLCCSSDKASIDQSQASVPLLALSGDQGVIISACLSR